MNEMNPSPLEQPQNAAGIQESQSPSPSTGTNRKPAMPPPVTLAILAICAVVWAGMNFLPKAGQAFSIGDILAPSAVDIWSGAYWGLITSAFVHVDVIHALFNLWWTKDFGRLLEPRFGAGKFILFVICSAIVSSGWQLAFSDTTGIGFSGVLYAFFGYMLAARRRDPAYGAFLNAKTIRWLIGWFFAGIALTWAKIWNIGNFAHGAGLVFGLLIGVSAGAGRFVIPARLAAMGAIISGLIPLFYMPWSASWRIRDQWQHVVARN
jgi:membrane associated rhomboid family serine protease